MKTKNIVFKCLLSNFVARIFHSYIFTHKNLETEILYFKQSKWFLSNFKQFCNSDFPLLYIPKDFLKNLGKQKNCFWNNLSNILKSIFIYIFFLLVYKKMVNTYYQKKQRIASIRSTRKVPKSFWRRKRKKAKISLRQI